MGAGENTVRRRESTATPTPAATTIMPIDSAQDHLPAATRLTTTSIPRAIAPKAVATALRANNFKAILSVGCPEGPTRDTAY